MVPAEPETTVIKGAALFGHDPAIVRSRIALMNGTYSTPTFNAALRDPKYKIQEDGQELCDKVFNTFIEKGKSVETVQPLQDTSVQTQHQPNQNEFQSLLPGQNNRY